jgi:transcriptional regulator with XRE-family HTH domain
MAFKPPQTTAREAIVSANVRRLREAAGITQLELAALIAAAGHDLSEQALGNIETGRRRVRIDDLYALGAGLDVPPLSLLNPGAGRGQWYEVTFEGGVTERINADDDEVGGEWIRFRSQGHPVYLASVGRVLGVRINRDGGGS